MSDDLVKRLRRGYDDDGTVTPLLQEAADCIESLRQIVSRAEAQAVSWMQKYDAAVKQT